MFDSTRSTQDVAMHTEPVNEFETPGGLSLLNYVL